MGHVRDLWTQPGPSGRRVRNERWGHGKRWQARWTEHGVDYAKSYGNRDAAEAPTARVTVDGPPTTRPRFTVAEYAEIWLSQQLHYATQTHRAARLRLEPHILPALGGLQLTEVTRGDVQRLVAEWSQKFAPATVHQSYSFLTTMFAYAVRESLIPSSPCSGV